ncbi:26461_t:CDS:1 [Dentiscutata erythropus]|uniref:26461_t:CDS:1 n=1 Tax=Dentiscutata erythropus TaxID=1348616 RepID=A0A9N8VU89_9GLOM|nr:26461_t:CDS:1 [Dentiscutata erythropus]
MNKRKRHKFKPFWTENTLKLSQHLWINDDVIHKRSKGSWFSVNEQISINDIDSPEIIFKSNEKKEVNRLTVIPNKKVNGLLKTRKIRLYPNDEEKRILKEWMRASTWTYNRALELINSGESKGITHLKRLCVNKDSVDARISSVPYDVRGDAVIDLLNAIKINENKRFEMKKRKTRCFVVQARKWNTKGGKKYKFLKHIETKEPKPEVEHAVRVKLDRLNRFWMCVPVPLETKTRMSNGILSIDPGSHTFLTCYNPRGSVIEIGNNDIQKIRDIQDRCFKYQSIIDTSLGPENKRKRHRLRNKILKTYKRIRNMIDDSHRKAAKYLCEHHSQILIPDFRTKDMVNKKQRRINKETTKRLISWSHRKFLYFLRHKAREYGTNIVECTEEYTSKTCGHCGRLNDKSSKDFRCDHCDLFVDRDFNGARNILLKHLTENNGFLHPNDC